jgi:outer membrane lipoprotein
VTYEIINPFYSDVSLTLRMRHEFSQQAESMVGPTITFERLKNDLLAFAGKYVKLGGIIVKTRDMKEGSQIEIVQFKLGGGDLPDESYPSGGRFLAVSPFFLDDRSTGPGAP